MSTSPNDSVFGVPERPQDARPDAPISDISNHRNADEPGAAQAPGSDVEWANSELLTIASTIEELQGRLEQANSRLAGVATVETTEYEIGKLFVEAQQFSEASLSNLELKIHEILREVEAKANQILTEATAEAHEIRRDAQQAAFMSSRTARELQAAITGFTAVNSELLKELGALNTMLTPANERRMSEIDPPSDATESD
jgi:cell division septum initiation protein DivIVA